MKKREAEHQRRTNSDKGAQQHLSQWHHFLLEDLPCSYLCRAHKVLPELFYERGTYFEKLQMKGFIYSSELEYALSPENPGYLYSVILRQQNGDRRQPLSVRELCWRMQLGDSRSEAALCSLSQVGTALLVLSRQTSLFQICNGTASLTEQGVP